MRYSLVNRVRGTFLGAFLGARLADQHISHLGEMAVVGTKSLISLGRFDLEHWLKLQNQLSVGAENHQSWDKILFTTIPLAIFFHESPAKLRSGLLQLQNLWPDDPVVKDTTLILGYAIAQSLNEKLDHQTFIPSTVEFLHQTDTQLPQILEKVNIFVQQGKALAQVEALLAKEEPLIQSLAIALYCFLTTLEDFPLTIGRATHLSLKQQDVRGILAGALSGAYNSSLGIPINWQILAAATELPTWGLSNFVEMLELADKLVAVWSGVYNLAPENSAIAPTEDSISLGFTPLSIFAAPHIIRPR
ncbi:ADP-ribosylation/Crystallin J1 [Richelia sinica FACHB-800]|uniref:ADP-ribosylation/Crystallin J1 n=1 Tax=Richelia sinica FACHB-800 TaxID=1357546 RepID=A0A975T6T4_9NOST|nr:ADP-ribosylglycohydrolase family protein [Richelia sinica]MBD2666327.1 ADP-ribosylglycohydrolase family protein [Richelia sinica FACHB-800]QXE22970.1 ADP-ribosylation/Crystallin J1 [Richelia sinica FACHB-800]